MNNLYSATETYYERWLTPHLREASEANPVVVLTGARQVGKSTLLRHAEPFRNWRYLTLDDFDVLRQAQENPQSLWAGTNEIVLDEVQKAPQLLAAVKQIVDDPRRTIRFVLSGSANLLLMQHASESLAGRAIYFTLHPMTVGELKSLPPATQLNALLSGNFPVDSLLPMPPPDVIPWLLRGFLPRLITLADENAWLRWWDGYVTTYLERDLRQVAQIDALVDFRRIMELLALRSGQLINQSDLARDAHLSQPTAHRYLNLLEATYLFERVPPYTASRTTRLLKAPKAFWSDPGLAVFLSGYFDQATLRQSRELGSFFETFVYLHLRVLASLMTPRARLYFWRTQSGDEVDFVLEHGRRIAAIEVKMTDNPSYRHAEGLKKFLSQHEEASVGILLHCGQAVRRLDEKIIAIPWSLLMGQEIQ